MRLEAVEALVHGLELGALLVADLAIRDDDEVDVTVDIRVPDRERPLEVNATEVLVEDRPHVRDEVVEKPVQIRVGSRISHRRRRGRCAGRST